MRRAARRAGDYHTLRTGGGQAARTVVPPARSAARAIAPRIHAYTPSPPHVPASPPGPAQLWRDAYDVEAVYPSDGAERAFDPLRPAYCASNLVAD
jgi:hypothetical protein